MELKTLFSPEKIGNVEIKNRIVRSATYTHSATNDGYVTDEMIRFYADLAKGGTGLIITGITTIDKIGTIQPGQACLYNDSYIEGQKKFVNAIHEYSGVKIAPQLSHSGRQGLTPIAPSAIALKEGGRLPKELTNEEVKEVISNFINAGRRVYESGYDILTLNASHGWLLCNFLSPLTNKRSDEFGGNIQNRMRILVDIYNGIVDEVGKDFPIVVKLQTQDFFEGGLTLDEGKIMAKKLVDLGFAAIEPSGGSAEVSRLSGLRYPAVKVQSEKEENFFLPAVKELKPIMKDSKLILMGGVRNPLTAENLLQENITDFIAISRPLICEPDLPNRWEEGDLTPPLCNSCNRCFFSTGSGIVACTVKERLVQERLNR
ncbi:MAG: NADH:flavin oxidoreductase [Promethearchaeota archaeon]|jgi:2,4-dienoyl-CoA reductase-like NADH-dependent reductase (Old Yellow Enzyme family)